MKKNRSDLDAEEREIQAGISRGEWALRNDSALAGKLDQAARLGEGKTMRARLDEALKSASSFGALLETVRLSQGKTLAGFAQHLGMSRTHLCDMEKGRRTVSPERAYRIAKKLRHDAELFVLRALQDQVDRAGIKLKIRAGG